MLRPSPRLQSFLSKISFAPMHLRRGRGAARTEGDHCGRGDGLRARHRPRCRSACANDLRADRLMRDCTYGSGRLTISIVGVMAIFHQLTARFLFQRLPTTRESATTPRSVNQRFNCNNAQLHSGLTPVAMIPAYEAYNSWERSCRFCLPIIRNERLAQRSDHCCHRGNTH